VKLRLLAAGFALAAALASAAAAAPTQSVSLEVERFFDTGCQCYKLRFSGAIPSPRANEYVTIMAQACGARSSTAFYGASTREGGSWSAETWERGGATYRALWNGRLSEPVRLRVETKMPINLYKLPRHRLRVTVHTGNSPQSMHRRFVELQRLAGGRWIRVRRERLVGYGSAGYGGAYVITLKIRTRGLRMRVLVPEESAAPCFVETASKTFVS
jgi:hypothetical protein